MNVNLKLSGLCSSLFVIRFSLIFFLKKTGGGGKQKRAVNVPNSVLFISIFSVKKGEKCFAQTEKRATIEVILLLRKKISHITKLI